jgi:hypothetical protein
MYFSFPALASLVLLQISTLPHSIVGALELHRGGQDSFENATTGNNNKVRRMKKSKKSQNHHDHQSEKSKKSKKKSSTVIDEMFTVMESTVDTCK